MEKVLVVPRSKLFPVGAFHGFLREDPERFAGIIGFESFFMERGIAEEDPSHKQIIPYIVLLRRGEVFTVVRLKTQGESRLHEKVSIGLGGHINPEDSENGKRPWEAALARELSEEVLIREPWEAKLIGAINDDEVPVGKVHFGLVYRVELPQGHVEVLEKDKMRGSFQTPSEAAQSYGKMETWSQFVFSALYPEQVLHPSR